MQSKQLLTLIQQLLAETKVTNIVSLDVKPLTAMTDYFVICTGRSSRHVKATAENIVDKLKEDYGIKAFGMAGLEKGDWALVDLGDVVLHIMQPEARTYYNLEKLWDASPEADQETVLDL